MRDDPTDETRPEPARAPGDRTDSACTHRDTRPGRVVAVACTISRRDAVRDVQRWQSGQSGSLSRAPGQPGGWLKGCSGRAPSLAWRLGMNRRILGVALLGAAV